MPQFEVDLYRPFHRFVDTGQYTVKAKSQKDKDTIQDLINRGVLSCVQEQRMDFRSFSVQQRPLDRLFEILNYYDCNKIYIGEFEFMEMMVETGDYYSYDVGKTHTMYGCEVITVPYMQGILPVKER